MLKIQSDFFGKLKIIFNFIKKNIFIISIIFTFLGIIVFGIFNSLSVKEINRDSYIILMNGNATLNKNPLEVEKKEKVKVGDIIKTTGKSTLAILEWGDGSVTRLGGNSSLKIDNLYFSQNLEKINISFELLSGKSWSTVVSFLGNDSYFKESFRNSVASVRGTIFNLNLDNEYLYVIDHRVDLIQKNGDIIIVNEKHPLNIHNFNFIALEEFLTNFKDKTWEKLNYKIDKDLFKGLEKQIHNDLDKIIDLDKIDIQNILNNDLKKEELYNQIITDYQKLNFVKPNNIELFKKKIELKEILIKLGNNENKGILMQNTFYDIKEIIDSKNYNDIDILLPLLKENNELFKSLNINNFININKIPNSIYSKFNEIKITLLNKSMNMQNIDIENKIQNLKEKANTIKETLITK